MEGTAGIASRNENENENENGSGKGNEKLTL
jgi:hypothetical protein